MVYVFGIIFTVILKTDVTVACTKDTLFEVLFCNYPQL